MTVAIGICAAVERARWSHWDDQVALTPRSYVVAIQAARGLKVDKRKIRLEEPIRETGSFMVEIEVGGGVTTKVKTIVAEAK